MARARSEDADPTVWRCRFADGRVIHVSAETLPDAARIADESAEHAYREYRMVGVDPGDMYRVLLSVRLCYNTAPTTREPLTVAE